MPTVSLSGEFNFQGFTSAGVLAASYRLYTYDAGTTSHKVTYTESTGTTAHTYSSDGGGGSYIALNSRGELPAPLFLQAGGYDLTLKDTGGNTIWTRRAVGVSDAATSASTAVSTLETDLADTASSTKGDYKIGAKSTSTGGAARTQHARNQEDFRSTDFDTLQNALTAATGKTLRVIGSYSLGSTAITVPAGTTVIAYEASLTWSGVVAGITFATGCKWFGGTLTGSGGATYNTSGNAFVAYGTAGAGGGDSPTMITGPIIEDVTITAWANAGIWAGYVNRMVVRNCTITTVGYAGIGGVSCDDAVIDGNYIDGVNGSGAADWYGIFVDRSEGTETQNPRSRRVKITNNTIKNVTSWEAIDTHAGQDFVISGNTITGCRFGIMVLTSDISAVESLGPYRVVVANNTINGSSTGACITVKGVAADRGRGIIIANNVCINGGWTNDTSEGAIRIYQVVDITVTGNTLRNSYVYGINLINDVYGATISGNTIIDPIDTTHTTPACIAIGSNNVYANITGNTLMFQDSGASTYVAVRSIHVAGSLTGLDVEIGPNALIGIASGRLTLNLGTTTGINTTGLMQQSGTGTLSGGTLAVTFAKRFPSTPKVTMGQLTANIARAGSISTTGFTVTGTGTDSISWQATT